MMLVSNWRSLWRSATIWVAAAWGGVMAYIVNDPTVAKQIWDAMPPEMQAFFPPWVKGTIAFVTVLGSLYAARAVRQPALPPAEPRI